MFSKNKLKKINKIHNDLGLEHQACLDIFGDTSGTTSLADYLVQNHKNYFETFPMRLSVACKFASSYAEFCKSDFFKIDEPQKDNKNSTYCATITAFFNMNNLYVRFCQESGDIKLSFDFDTHTLNTLAEPTYNNFEFLGSDLQKRDLNHKKYVNIREKYGHLSGVFTISTILFFILFGYHPLKGREYFERPFSDTENDLKFFWAPKKFIFNLEDNPNRFINGYHTKAWLQWKTFTSDQKQFFLDAFDGKISTYEDLYGRWAALFEQKG